MNKKNISKGGTICYFTAKLKNKENGFIIIKKDNKYYAYRGSSIIKIKDWFALYDKYKNRLKIEDDTVKLMPQKKREELLRYCCAEEI